jgi:hypothetical protein
MTPKEEIEETIKRRGTSCDDEKLLTRALPSREEIQCGKN